MLYYFFSFFRMDICCICSKGVDNKDKGVNVLRKGLRTLLEASLARNYQNLEEIFRESLTKGGMYVHKACRKRYVDLRSVEKLQEPQAKRSRASTRNFEWKTDCLFCGDNVGVQSSKKNPSRHTFSHVETVEFRDIVLEKISDNEDTFLSQVRHRLLSCIDLVSVQAVYHTRCLTNFSLNSQTDSNKRKSRGRPADQHMHETFEKACQWFENTDGSKSLKEIQDFMRAVAGDEHTASLNWLKQKLLEKYQSNLHITTDGYRSIVTLGENLENIVKQAWYRERCNNVEDEKQRIISFAAEIIKEEIQDLSECNKEYYPQEDNIANKDEGENWLPKMLLKFLSILIPSIVKRISIGQSIVYAVRPNYAFPPPFYLD